MPIPDDELQSGPGGTYSDPQVIDVWKNQATHMDCSIHTIVWGDDKWNYETFHTSPCLGDNWFKDPNLWYYTIENVKTAIEGEQPNGNGENGLPPSISLINIGLPIMLGLALTIVKRD